jgi:hypothetical protein
MIRGTVLDETTGRVVPAAQVMIARVVPDSVFRAVAAADGSFAVRLDGPGEYCLRVESLGYAPLLTNPVKVVPDGVLTLELRLRSDAIALQPLRVVAERREPIFMRDIRRRQAMGFGRLVTREELDARGNPELRSVLEDVPGVQVMTVGRGRDQMPVVLTRAALHTGQSACHASLYVNGVRQYPMMLPDTQEMRDRVQEIFATHTGDIEAIEVYRGLTEVGEFGDPFGVCGVVAIWLTTGQERRAQEPAGGAIRLAPDRIRVSGAAYAFSGKHAPHSGLAVEAALGWPIMRTVSVGLYARYAGHELAREAVEALTAGLDANEYMLPDGAQPLSLFAVGAEMRIQPWPSWRIRPVLASRVQRASRRFDIHDDASPDRVFPQESAGWGFAAAVGIETWLSSRFSLAADLRQEWQDFGIYPNLERPWRPTAARWRATALSLGTAWTFR